ncbi:unnamed protein product, partial [marine sediment metagenome]
ADEPLAKLDNVMVAESNAPENTKVTMTPNADKTVWTGTYITGDKEDRDGTATVYAFGYEDLVGNEGVEDTTTFNVDRMAPPAPNLDAITGFPETPTPTATWLIESEAEDNLLGALVPLEKGTVKIRVGTTVYTLTPTATGYYSKSITLPEGITEVGIQHIDRAGNAGEENAENITLDSIAPSITWDTIADKALVDGVQINNATPTITLTIHDAGLGVDNWGFNADDNTGYSVQLWDENENVIGENLANALAHDNNVLAFENTLSKLADSTYYIYVEAGDSQLMDNALIEFVVDTVAPGAPSVDAAYVITSTMDAPMIVKKASRAIAGTAEAGADITVYGTVDTTETTLTTPTLKLRAPPMPRSAPSVGARLNVDGGERLWWRMNRAERVCGRDGEPASSPERGGSWFRGFTRDRRGPPQHGSRWVNNRSQSTTTLPLNTRPRTRKRRV